MDYYGYAGSVLDLDLSSGESEIIPMESDWIQDYIGGAGLSFKLFSQFHKPKIDPLSEDNVVVLGVGPLLGSGMPLGSKVFAVTKFALPASEDGKHYITSAIGGFKLFGIMMKRAGFDHLIIRGKSTRPVYLYIKDGGFEVKDASSLRGADAYETTAKLQALHPGSGVIANGPAGENLVRFSFTIVDGLGTLGRGGLGAVLGSKNVKAIVAKGTRGIKVARKKELFKKAKAITDLIKSQEILRNAQTLGAHIFWEMIYLKNMSSGTWTTDKFNKLYGVETFLKSKKRSESCFSCPIGCKTQHEVRDGSFAGVDLKTTHLINTANMGQKLELEDYQEAYKLNDELNRAGVGMYTFSEMADYMTRLLKEGKIAKEDLQGFDFQRNLNNYLEFLDKLVKREGIGAVAADGWFSLSEHLEHDALVHYKNSRGIVKGTDCIFDARFNRLDSSMVSQVVGPKGGFQAWGNLGGRLTTEDVPEIYNTPEKENLGRLTAQSEDCMMVLNSLGACYVIVNTLSMFGYPILKTLAEIYGYTTGIDIEPRELKLKGERCFNLYKMLNVREGFNRSDDCFPHVWLEPKHTPERTVVLKTLYARKEVNEQILEQILDEYYAERGWDVEKGTPTQEKLKSLKLDFLL
ncbi:MAG: aldehyde ferredoxin oxidoreductase N-terminal domain-containing protein [Candidatus Jordarchaeum sp.]|uniref:aldehyde ferredoxin oxidoreductase N-terminal domain-containing protein n=1 Tax=Candidatus Jordarchaeum sp. TaxID=2823881 RepID=UPI00404973D3